MAEYIKTYEGSPFQGDGLSIGSIVLNSFITIPDGFLECNGQQISRTTFITLFNKIGTTYGAGDGSTTFNLPDLRGEFVRGFDHGRGVDSNRILGSSQDDDIKSHNHVLYSNDTTGASGGNGVLDYSTNHVVTNGTTGSTGGSETRPKNVALMYIMKVSVVAVKYDEKVNGANADTLDGYHSTDFVLKGSDSNTAVYAP